MESGAAEEHMFDLNKFSLVLLDGKAPTKRGWEKWCLEKSPLTPEQANGRNVGIACGPVSGVMVLDIDHTEQFAADCKKYGWTTPTTFEVQTGSGKRHLYYKYPTDGKVYGSRNLKTPVKPPRGEKHPTVLDIKAVGGQVVAPGSIHPDTGLPYRVEHDLPFADPPQWLLDASLQGFDRRRSNGISVPPSHDAPDRTGDFAKFTSIEDLPIRRSTKALIRDGAPVGERSEAIMSVLTALAWANLSDHDIIAIFETEAIGQKYREKRSTRVKWLQAQIDKARRYVTDHAGDEWRAEQEGDEKHTRKFSFTHVGSLVAQVPVYLVKSLIEVDTFFSLYGDTWTGKSLAALDMCVCVASGIDFHGLKVKQSPTIYIAGEGHGGLARRIEAICLTRGIDRQRLPMVVSSMATGVNDPVRLRDTISAIHMVADEYGPPGLIVIDTLQRNFGNGDENQTADMSKFVAGCDRIRELYHSSVGVIQHVGLSDKSRARGSIVLRASADAEYSLTKCTDGAICLDAKKMKDGPMPGPMRFRIRSMELPGLIDEDLNSVTAPYLEKVDSVEQVPGEILGMTPADTVLLMAGQGLNQLEIAKKLNKSKSTISHHVKLLKKQGLLTNRGALTKEGRAQFDAIELNVIQFDEKFDELAIEPSIEPFSDHDSQGLEIQ